MIESILKFMRVWFWLGLIKNPGMFFCIRNHKGNTEADRVVLALMEQGVKFKKAYSSRHTESLGESCYLCPESIPSICIWVENFPYAWGKVYEFPVDYPYWVDACQTITEFNAKLGMLNGKDNDIGCSISRGVAIQLSDYLSKQGFSFA